MQTISQGAFVNFGGEMKSKQFVYNLENVTECKKWLEQGIYPTEFEWGEYGYEHGITILHSRLNPMVASNRLHDAIDYLGMIVGLSLNEMRLK